MRHAALALTALALASCGSRSAESGAAPDAPAAPAPAPTAPAPAQPPPAAIDAAALLAKLECSRCHDGTGLAAAPAEKHCVTCHQQILTGTFEAPRAALVRWKQNLVSLNHVPSLTSIGARLRRDWVRDQLLRPVDVRPALPATMPRLRITAEEASALAELLVPGEAPAASFLPADAERGRELYAELRCATCHLFTGAGAPSPPPFDRQPVAAVALAPDLAHTRARFQSGALAAFLRDPFAVKPDSAMPRFEISEPDAHALAAYVLESPLAEPAPAPPLPARLPPLAREVRFAEVERRVFRKICWHCHSSPAYGLGDGGAGNTGGFGYPPRGLDLSGSTGVLSGALGDDGRRHSILAPLEDGTPRIIAFLLARHREVAGEAVPGITGMPLGLPPLSMEEIQLVDSWIAQGRPL